MSNVSFEQLVQFLERAGPPFRAHEADEVALAAIPGRQGTYAVLLRLDREREVLLVSAGQLLSVPPERRGAVAQAAAHLNTTILLGSFGLDLTDGELRYDLPLLHRGVGLCDAQLAHACGALVVTLDEKLPILQRLCWTQESAAAALGLPLESPLRAMLDALDADDGSASRSA